MGNAVAMSGAGIQAIHDSVYREAQAGIPEPIWKHLIGDDPSEHWQKGNSFRERAINPYRFAEFLPCFAIRPIFNELIYLLHYRLGVGLLKATVVIPVTSYWILGWVVLAWVWRYVGTHWAALLSIVLLFCPPLWDMARSTTPDALSTLAVMSALFLLFEKQKFLPGMILLLVSVYIRTDNIFLVLPVLAYLYFGKFGFKGWEIAVLSLLALASVPLINHFAGDYGLKVLYYRSFVEAPVAVGEITPAFGIADYLAALKAGIIGAVHGPYIPFFLMGLIGLLRRPPRAIFGLGAVVLVYTAVHLVIFPNPESRFFGPFFAGMGIVVASTLSARESGQIGADRNSRLGYAA